MGLKDVSIKKQYRSGENNTVREFYIPCLSASVIYSRAVGYFTSGGLAFAAKGIVNFLKNNGKMRLIASPLLNERDCEAINAGYRQQDKILLDSLLRELESVNSRIEEARLSCLASLIALRRLEIKLAVRVGAGGKVCRGIYHEKIGLFVDTEKNTVAFNGSPNETTGGLVENFESIYVFRSWNDPEERIPEMRSHFERLWSEDVPGLRILPFPDAAQKRLIKFRNPELENYDPEENDQSEQKATLVNGAVELWPHQSEAINCWQENGCQGVLKMATGTGKTITALSGLKKVFRGDTSFLAVVVVPYKHLVDQWEDRASQFGHKVIKCSSDFPDWEARLTSVRIDIAAGISQSYLIISTYDTFSLKRFQEHLRKIKIPKVVVADEVHHFGSPCYRPSLDMFDMRLGLSATPERPSDPGGTEWIFSNVGPIVFEFGMDKAIPDFLCPYRYYIETVRFSRGEYEQYLEVVSQISAAYARGNKLDEEDPAKETRIGPLLRKRLELIGGAQEKLSKTLEVVDARVAMSGDSGMDHALFYCGSRLFSGLKGLLGEKGLIASQFTFEESREERKAILEDFSKGRIQVIVAKKCLDEGMDIPATKTAVILASSTNPMEFIQRRGRVLRKYPGKERADIYDLFVLPPRGQSISDAEKKLVERELIRASEFAETAENRASCSEQLLQLKKRYGLLHI